LDIAKDKHKKLKDEDKQIFEVCLKLLGGDMDRGTYMAGMDNSISVFGVGAELGHFPPQFFLTK